MRKLIMWNVVTLDGCFEGEQPWDLSFHNLVWGPELEALSIQQLNEAGALVFGEKTYQGMAKYWVGAEESDPAVAPLMNSIPKIVCSSTLQTASWNNTTIVRDAVTEIARLKEEEGGALYVFGSGTLSKSLMNAGLFDEIRLCIAPTILGKGRRLFTERFTKQNLSLLESTKLANGGVIVRYSVAL